MTELQLNALDAHLREIDKLLALEGILPVLWNNREEQDPCRCGRLPYETKLYYDENKRDYLCLTCAVERVREE